tara:strand:- start:256 stop:369 length:114 start_codon:yes stop_codon:yes gene_type:complete
MLVLEQNEHLKIDPELVFINLKSSFLLKFFSYKLSFI